jgi:alpha-ketoglutarate-dependent taurine dioxygenase
MDYVAVLNEFTLDAIKEAFKKNVIVVVKKKAFTLKSFWDVFKNCDILTLNNMDKVIQHFFGNEGIEEFNQFIKNITYDEYPGVLKVNCKKNDLGIQLGIVPIKEKLNWHRDTPAFVYPYRILALHGQNTVKSVTYILETVTQYSLLSSEDKNFVDSLVYEYKNEKLYETVQKELKKEKKRIITGVTNRTRSDETKDYPNLTYKEIFLNFTDDHYNNVDKPLIQNSIMGIPGFAFEYNTLLYFKGKSLKESIQISQWLESIIVKDKYKYSHHWDDGDVVLFDTICTQHARDPYEDEDRLLHRLIFNFEKNNVSKT